MLQSRLMEGGSEGPDRYRDWRLDVDHMSYEVCQIVSSLIDTHLLLYTLCF